MIHNPYDGWDPPDVAVHFTSGPERIYDNNPTPPLPSRPVGFRVPVDTTPCHCIVRDNRWRRQAETCPQHREGQPWEDE